MNRLSDYLTVVEAAKVLGVSKDTLRRWDNKGKLTAKRHPVTRYRLYLKRELEDFLSRLGSGS
jgi:DNA (cytosine-5)-methyltransferase 1